MYSNNNREAPRPGKSLFAAAGAVLDFIFPPQCPACLQRMDETKGVCLTCRQLLSDRCTVTEWSGSSVFQHLEGELNFSAAVTCWDYLPALENIVHDIKYNGCARLGRWIGAYAAVKMSLCLEILGPDLLIPVPLHAVRKRERGYNQSEMIARGFAAILRLPLRKHVIARCSATATQTALGAHERQQNVSGAFRQLGHEDLSGKRVLLIDDVITTGATLNSAAGVLRACGAEAVFGAALARPRLGSEN